MLNLTRFLVLWELSGREGVGEGRVGGWGRVQAQVGGGGRGPVPGPAGSASVEHAQLVVHTVRRHLAGKMRTNYRTVLTS